MSTVTYRIDLSRVNVVRLHFLKSYKRIEVSNNGHSQQNMSISQQSDGTTQQMTPSHDPLTLPYQLGRRNPVICIVRRVVNQQKRQKRSSAILMISNLLLTEVEEDLILQRAKII